MLTTDKQARIECKCCMFLILTLASVNSSLWAQDVLIDRQYHIDSVIVSYYISHIAYPVSMDCCEWKLDFESKGYKDWYSITEQDSLERLMNNINNSDTCDCMSIEPKRKLFFFSDGKCVFSICIGLTNFISGGKCYEYNHELRNFIEAKIKSVHPGYELKFDTSSNIYSKHTGQNDDCKVKIRSLEILSLMPSPLDSFYSTHFVITPPCAIFNQMLMHYGKAITICDGKVIDCLFNKLNALSLKDYVPSTKTNIPSKTEVLMYKLVLHYDCNLAMEIYIGENYVMIGNDYYDSHDDLIYLLNHYLDGNPQ